MRGTSVRSVPRDQPEINVRALERDLRRALAHPAGEAAEVRFDVGSRALYATDASNYRQVPVGVVIPRRNEDVLATLAACRAHGVPVVSRGGGTALAGQTCNVAVVLDFSKYLNRVLEVNRAGSYARVQPGTILDHLGLEAKKHGLLFGPDPATHTHNTLGGMIGNNSCGMHAQMAGRTSENVLELEIVTYDGLRMRVGETSETELAAIISEGGRRGEIYEGLRKLRDRYAQLIQQRYPNIPRRISGYNLDDLLPEKGFNVARALVGSESTCVTILEAKLRLLPNPNHRALLVIGYPDVFSAGDHVPELLAFKPIGLEGLDDLLIKYSEETGKRAHARELLPDGNGWLMVEFGGATAAEASERAFAAASAAKLDRFSSRVKVFTTKEEQEKVWKVRENGLGAASRIPRAASAGGDLDTWPGWEDSAVPPERVGGYLRDLKKLMDKFSYQGSLYGHFGQGCVHVSISFDLVTADGLRKYRSFIDQASDLVLFYGGSLSGEHGDGQSRAEFLQKMYGPELISAFGEFKRIWDPEGKMNPGKLVAAHGQQLPNRMDENLRLGTDYAPPSVKTHFQFPDDKGSFEYAARRCVGVGECRKTEGGTMCPSFMVTREEKHSTRGRAHALFEMLHGGAIKKGWRSKEVKETLDLCLSCKGCKGDCPVQVDIATYKAEFLAHYYRGRLRPLAAYSMGLIDFWARIASRVPRLANFITQTPILRDIAKFLGGIHAKRTLPPFAPVSFREWFETRDLPVKRPVKDPDPDASGNGEDRSRMRVVLWPDTFNNFFHPETAIAAVRVLEAAGYDVTIPKGHVCCGRPLYDYGMLDLAKTYLLRNLEVMRAEIRAGVPVVVLEPSCLSVFRDEMKNLLPNDLDSQRLSQQSFLLAEFLAKRIPQISWPKLSGKALIQGHCHQKALFKMTPDQNILKSLGLELEIPDSGCCGLAGSFGFERDDSKYDLSKKAGERVLLPAVRKAGPETWLVADGFSCRTQIEQGTGRKAMHIAEVIAAAMDSHLQDSPQFNDDDGKRRRQEMTPLLKRSEESRLSDAI